MPTPIFAPPGADPIDVSGFDAYEHILDVTDGLRGVRTDIIDVYQLCKDVVDICQITKQYSSTLFARILHETDYLRFTGDVDPEQFNFAGLGATGNGVKGLSFPNQLAGVLAVAFHEMAYRGDIPEYAIRHFDPRYMLARQRHDFAEYIEDFGNGVWGTDPDYAEKMLRIHRRLKGEADIPNSNLFVMFAAGHHNTQGGSPVEYDIVGDITEYTYLAFKRHGVKTVCLTPDGPDDDDIPGDGDSPYNIYDTWTKGIAAHGVPDLAFEIHTEGVSNPNTKGAFVIYPDWGGDVDGDVMDLLGPSIVSNITSSTEIGKRGNGLMSEKQTGVGASGFRLGFFAATAPHKATCTRFIVECGTHTNPDELKLLQQDSVKQQIAEAIVRACLEFYGIAYQPIVSEPSPPAEDIVTFGNGKSMVHGFRGRYLELHGINRFYQHTGMPLTGEFVVYLPRPDGKGGVVSERRTAQIFEKDVWTWNPDSALGGEWQIQSALHDERDYIIAYAKLVGVPGAENL